MLSFTEQFCCTKFGSKIMIRYHIRIVYQNNISDKETRCSPRLEDRVDEILKKSKYRTLKETLKLWELITTTNGNILASIFILICCLQKAKSCFEKVEKKDVFQKKMTVPLLLKKNPHTLLRLIYFYIFQQFKVNALQQTRL